MQKLLRYKLNAARCKMCNKVVENTKENEQSKCDCGNLIITGGLKELIRYIKQIDYYHDQYEELSIDSYGNIAVPGWATIKPQTALEKLRRGRCFIQYHLHSPSRSWRMLDEHGQDLQAVEIQISEDGHYDVSARFRFKPVAGFNFYVCGGLSLEDMNFLDHVKTDIISPFIEHGQDLQALYKILIKNGYQDRTGMTDNEWRL